MIIHTVLSCRSVLRDFPTSRSGPAQPKLVATAPSRRVQTADCDTSLVVPVRRCEFFLYFDVPD
jgi:hypothetical protein